MCQTELFPIQKGPKWGFCDQHLNIKIPLNFDVVSFFHEGIALIREGDKYGYIKKDGSILVKPQFDFATPFVNGYAFVILEKGEVLFSLIDSKGDLVARKVFNQETSVNNNLVRDKDSNGLWGFRSIQGNFTIPPKYQVADDFSEGYALVSQDADHYTFIDTLGKKITQEEFEFEELKISVNAKPFFKNNLFSNGLAVIKKNGKYGYINSKGEIAIAPQYTYCERFSAGLAAVKIDSLWGFINTAGQMIIKPAYKQVGQFSNDLCLVSNQEGLYDVKWKIINRTGVVVSKEFDFCPLQFNDKPKIESLILTYFYKEEVWGYINIKGDLIFKSQGLDWHNNYPLYQSKYY